MSDSSAMSGCFGHVVLFVANFCMRSPSIISITCCINIIGSYSVTTFTAYSTVFFEISGSSNTSEYAGLLMTSGWENKTGEVSASFCRKIAYIFSGLLSHMGNCSPLILGFIASQYLLFSSIGNACKVRDAQLWSYISASVSGWCI